MFIILNSFLLLLTSCDNKPLETTIKSDKVYYIEDLESSSLLFHLNVYTSNDIYEFIIKNDYIDYYRVNGPYEENNQKLYKVEIKFIRKLFCITNLIFKTPKESYSIDIGCIKTINIPDSAEDIKSTITIQKDKNNLKGYMTIQNKLNRTIYIKQIMGYQLPKISMIVDKIIIGDSYIYAYDTKLFYPFIIIDKKKFVHGSGYIRVVFYTNTSEQVIYSYFRY